MGRVSDDFIVSEMVRYEHASRQCDSWKRVLEDSDGLMRAYFNRRFLGVVKRRARLLCKRHGDGGDRHWWLSGVEFHPSVDHSTTPWSVSALFTVRMGLYIHVAGEVARDELKVSFAADEMVAAFARLERLMAAGVAVPACGARNGIA